MRVSLVLRWMLRAAVLVSQLKWIFFPVVSNDFCLLPAEYTYPPLNSSQYYLPPSATHDGDLTCDCNTVMYRYGFRPS